VSRDTSQRVISLVTICALGGWGPPARAGTPLGYLRGYGPKADSVAALTWGLLVISIVVVVVICTLVLAGIWFRRVRVAGPIEHIPIEITEVVPDCWTGR
jgi:hypothetical protein